MTGRSEAGRWGNLIRGGPRLGQLKRAYEPYLAQLASRQKQVAIVRFEPPQNANSFALARYEAAAVSMRQKVKTFGYLNCPVEEYVRDADLSRKDFEALLTRLNENERITGVIVQLPVPEGLEPSISIIDENKDIDALNGSSTLFTTGATAEGIFRMAAPFLDDSVTVAVVGARGFVGADVTQLLRQNNINCLGLDQGDNLLRTKEADVVISVTGQPEVLDERHIFPHHRLVIDSGFVPMEGEVYGDVRKTAYGIPQNITPVPGGTGPTEMAILMERLVRKEVAPAIEPWGFPTATYLSRTNVEAIQMEWAASISSTVRAAYEIKRAESSRSSQGIERVETNLYALTLNQDQNTLVLESRGAVNVELATFNSKSGEVISVSGLSAIDAERWVTIRQRLEQAANVERSRGTDLER